MRRVIVNSTPLIALCNADLLNILKKIYGSIIIPKAVFDEVTAKKDSAWVKPLLAQEKKRTARLVGEVPIYDIVVGNGEERDPAGQAGTSPDQAEANISVKQMDILESKFAALGTGRRAAAMPKGPLPPQAKMRGVQRTMKRR